MTTQNSTPARPERGLFERHLQTGLQVLIVGLIFWASQSLVELRDKMIRYEERDQIKTTILNQHQDDLNKTRLDIQDIKQDIHDLKSEKQNESKPHN